MPILLILLVALKELHPIEMDYLLFELCHYILKESDFVNKGLKDAG